MPKESTNEHYMAGLKYLAEDNLDKALRSFEKAYKEESENPYHMSYYGLCKALRGGEIGFGLELCTKAIKKAFYKAVFYNNLGRIYMAAGNKKGALKVLKKGLAYDPENEELNRYLVELGFRGKPILPSLPRANPLNKYLGILIRRTIPGLVSAKKKKR